MLNKLINLYKSFKDESPKFKFRVIKENVNIVPYKVQQLKFGIWWNIAQYNSEEDALGHLWCSANALVKSKNKRKHTVIREYTEKDYIVDRLKGKV